MSTLQKYREGGIEFLNALQESWNDPEAVERVAGAWGVLQTEVDAWRAMNEEDHTLTNEEAFLRTSITAAMSSYVLEHRAEVTEEVILTATPPELREYEMWYRAELARLHQLLQDREEAAGSVGVSRWDDKAWVKAFADFFRLAGFLWQVERRLGQR